MPFKDMTLSTFRRTSTALFSHFRDVGGNVNFHVKYPLLFSFNQNRNVVTKVAGMKFYEYPLSVSRIVTY
jgi:hypothetical protein